MLTKLKNKILNFEELDNLIKNRKKSNQDRTIYIHIGAHKTGTTTIQHALYKNQDVLRKNGILCPKSGRSFLDTAGNHNLGFELAGIKHMFNPENGTWADLKKEINHANDCQKVLISSEVLSILDIEKIKYIKELLNQYKVKIIMYIRRQDETLQSTWVEVVRNVGQKPPIVSFHDWLQKFNYRVNNTEYLEIINKWEHAFSRENLILKILEPSQINKSLFNDFLSSCSINLPEITEVPNKNISPGVKTIEAIRLIKNNLDFEKIKPNDWTFLVKSIEELGNANNWNKRKLNYIDEELSNKIMSSFEKENQIIMNKYFSSENLFSPKKFDDNSIDNFTYDDFSKDEIIELFSFIIDLGFNPQV
jgi:hypothetical protein